MTTENQNLVRADIAISDLARDGGLLNPQQTNAFIDMLLDQPTLLPQTRVIRMNAPEVKINRIGFDKRILRAANQTGSANDNGSNDRYVKKADRAAPVTAQIQLVSKEVIAEVRLPYELLEDNIEGVSLETHILRLIAERAALDLEELALWGDTANATDPYLALVDGWMKRSAGQVFDNQGAGLSSDLFAKAQLTFHQKYLRFLAQMRGYITQGNMIRYRQAVAQRQTGYGDAMIVSGTAPLFAHGLQLEGVPSLALAQQAQSGLVTFPKNLLWGIRREVSIETDKDIRSREYIIVLTMRCGTQIDDVEAVVQLQNIATP